MSHFQLDNGYTFRFRHKPRLFVLTDISSLTASVREPDDGQSMLRLLLYANEFTIEGLVASSNLQHGQQVRPELIHEAITAYSHGHANLLQHHPDYPEPQLLHSCVKAGQPIAEPICLYVKVLDQAKKPRLLSG